MNEDQEILLRVLRVVAALGDDAWWGSCWKAFPDWNARQLAEALNAAGARGWITNYELVSYRITDAGRAVLAEQESDAALDAEWEQAQRAAFEAWAEDAPRRHRLVRFTDVAGTQGGYVAPAVQLAWEAWREAARRAGR